jgi:hypothetical protein
LSLIFKTAAKQGLENGITQSLEWCAEVAIGKNPCTIDKVAAGIKYNDLDGGASFQKTCLESNVNVLR